MIRRTILKLIAYFRGLFNISLFAQKEKIISQNYTSSIDKLCFIGVGGGGTNIIEDISKIDNNHTFIHINSDYQALKDKSSKDKILLGYDKKLGLGCGGEEQCGKNLIDDDVKSKLDLLIKDTNLVYLVSALGGGVGSGATPEIVKYLKNKKKKVVVFATMPFGFEGKVRNDIAQRAIDKIKIYSDNLVVMQNDNIINSYTDGNMGLKDAFHVVSSKIYESILYNNLGENMEEKDYNDFFDKLNDFKEIQNKQKMRGLNDYNMVNVVRKATHEVGMHSNVIYSLINPNGLHYQNDLFLNIFINKVLGLQDFGEIIQVQAEEITSTIGQDKRIDFTIKSNKYYIGIEMKINHHDTKNQLSDYLRDLKNKANQDNNQKVIIYYLTKNGKSANPISHNGIEYEKVSFEKHILEWIQECQKEVKNIINLNEAFENYKNIVIKVIKQYKGNVMTLNEYMKKNQTMYNQIGNIKNELNKLQKSIEKDFWEELKNVLNENNNYDFQEDSWEKLKVGLSGKILNTNTTINIIRNHNLYYDIVNPKNIEKVKEEINHIPKNSNDKVSWGYISPTENSQDRINFEKTNQFFWKLGEDNFREEIISKIVEKVNKLVAIAQ